MSNEKTNCTEPSYILKENLAIALQMAIDVREIQELGENNYTGDSALLAGWKENLEALKNGKLEIK